MMTSRIEAAFANARAADRGILGVFVSAGDPDRATSDAILDALVDAKVDIVELGMAKGATVTDDGWIRLQIDLTTSGCPLRAQIQKDIRARLTSLPGVTRVTIDWGELTQDERSEAMAKASKPGELQRLIGDS